ncbi:MAG: ammonium transporter [Nitrospinae bacterium]|nr:ammonium transporter [Nitrospinota bacterium]
MKKLLTMLFVAGMLFTASSFADEAPAPAPTAPSAPAPATPTPAPAPAGATPAVPAPAPAPKVDSGDTSWVLTSSALVLLMTVPGLALFYGGLVRRKNVLSVLMQSFIAAGVITVQWVVIGFSLAFGPDVHGIIGNLDWAMLRNVSFDTPNADYAATIPHQAFMIFQMMFAIITPALITGAFAERFKFSSYLVFITLWATIVYDPIAHWVWGASGAKGWINNMGALDFAGGTVVHISSGVAALACALVLGKRKGYPQEPMLPHNLTMTLIGASLLWVGWFGFNAGSALAAGGGRATSAFVVTHVATAAASLSWLFAEWWHRGKPTILGAASGAVAGLVAITPASGFVFVGGALVIGLAAGAVCYFAVVAKGKFGYDDSLDTFGVHAVGGTLGAILTGVFAVKVLSGTAGLLEGNSIQLWIQIKAVLASWIYSFVVTFIILKVIDATMGLRVSKDEEEQGLDLTQHGETGYMM